MKVFNNVSLGFFFVIIVELSGCSAVDEMNSTSIEFRGAALGSKPLPDMILLAKETPMLGISTREISDTYKKLNEPLKVGGLDIKAVTYEYYENRLFYIKVDLSTDNQLDCPQADKIVSALEEQYRINMTKYSEDYINGNYLVQWKDSRNRLTYMCDKPRGTNAIFFTELSIYEEVMRNLNLINEANDSVKIKSIRQGL